MLMHISDLKMNYYFILNNIVSYLKNKNSYHCYGMCSLFLHQRYQDHLILFVFNE